MLELIYVILKSSIILDIQVYQDILMKLEDMTVLLREFPAYMKRQLETTWDVLSLSNSLYLSIFR